LAFVSAKGKYVPEDQLNDQRERLGVTLRFTEKEQQFMDCAEPDDQTAIDYSWHIEALHVLLWSLKLTKNLEWADEHCDADDVYRIVLGTQPAKLRQRAKLRHTDELFQEADLAYRQQWAVRNARLNGEPLPELLHPNVVAERYYALQWLIGGPGTNYDEVETHT
ncbi:MAG: DUF4272 domain-containing protein, partial [Bacilli bacterium]